MWLGFRVLVGRCFFTLTGFVVVLLLLCPIASAQVPCHPKDEIFGGYSVLFPNGWGDLDYKINTIPISFDASYTYYLPTDCHIRPPNFGFVIDGSGHFLGGTTPPNLDNGSNNCTAAGYVLGGPQYKFHTPTVSPFVRVLIGGANLSPDCCHGTQWSFAVGGGGGLDLDLNPRFSIRLAQVDYIYSNYDHAFPSSPQAQGNSARRAADVPLFSNHPTQWNSVRLAAGVVFNIGEFCNEPLSCTVSETPAPTEVWAGEPVRLSTTGSHFNPKHPASYAWTTNGRQSYRAPRRQATEIDTTGLGAGQLFRQRYHHRSQN